MQTSIDKHATEMFFYNIVWIGISTPLFLAKPLLKSANCPSPPPLPPPFLGNPPYKLAFCEPPLKLGFFCGPQKY